MTANLNNAKYKLAPDVLFQDLEGESVFLNMKNDNYYGLDEIGSRIWQLLTENADLKSVIGTLLNEYETDIATLEEDIRELIKNLTEEKLIELA